MALIRGYSKVDQEGRIIVPLNICRYCQLSPDYPVEIAVVRIINTVRFPHMVIYRFPYVPFISPMEATMLETQAKIDAQGRIILSQELMEELKLGPGYIVEFKIHGAKGQHWVVVHNRGPWRQTTLQERMGHKNAPKWRKVEVNY